MNTPRHAVRSSPRTLASLFTVLAISASMHASLDRSIVPAPSAATAVAPGTHHSFQLANGMRVIVVENKKLPLVSVQVKFDAPPYLQGELAGYQDLLGELLTTGTGSHSKAELDEVVDGIGGQLMGTADGLYASSLKKHFPMLMELVHEVITDATFPEEEFEAVRTRALSGVQSRASDPDQVADVVARVMTFNKGYPYGEVTTAASLSAVRREHVDAFYRYTFKPANGFLVFVGDIGPDAARELAERHFGNWPGREVQVNTDARGLTTVEGLGVMRPALKAPAANKSRQVRFVDMPGAEQSVVRAVFPIPDLLPNDPMALAAQVMNTILGGGVFNARLMQNLREDKGYTYGVHSSLDMDRWCSSFQAACSVRSQATDSALSEIIFEVEHIQQMAVTDEELELAKNYMAGSFGRALEDPRTVARFALSTALNDLPADHFATYTKRLERITKADVQAAAQRFLHPDHMQLVVVGDRQVVGNRLAPLSFSRAVVYYDTDGEPYREAATKAPEGLSAQDVLNTYIKALGGEQAMAAVQDLLCEYRAEGPHGTVTRKEWRSKGRYAMRATSNGSQVEHVVYDGQRAVRTDSLERVELVDTDLAELRKLAYIFPELHYTELDQKARLTGVVEVEGRPCYRLHVENAMDGSVFQAYFDTASGLLVRRVEDRNTPTAIYHVVEDFRDHRPVNGIQFPHTVRRNEALDLTYTLTGIRVDRGMDERVFRME